MSCEDRKQQLGASSMLDGVGRCSKECLGRVTRFKEWQKTPSSSRMRSSIVLYMKGRLAVIAVNLGISKGPPGNQNWKFYIASSGAQLALNGPTKQLLLTLWPNDRQDSSKSSTRPGNISKLGRGSNVSRNQIKLSDQFIRSDANCSGRSAVG